MNKILLAVLILGLGGCSMLDPIEKGTRSTTIYDKDGKRISTVTEDYAIGDKATEYQQTARAIANSSGKTTTAQVSGILAITAPQPTDSEAVKAWKGTAGLLALQGIDNHAAATIKAVHYGADKYDVSGKAIDRTGQSIIPIGATITTVKALDTANPNTTITADNGSTVTTERTENHATTIGDESPASTTNTVSGDTVQAPEPEPEPEEVADEGTD